MCCPCPDTSILCQGTVFLLCRVAIQKTAGHRFPNIAAVVFAISAGFFFASFFGAIGARRWKKYAQKSTATLIQVTKSYKRGASQWYEIEYTCDGILHTVMVAQKYVEGVSTETPAGTRVPIWYDPKKPERVIIAEDLSMAEPVKSWKRTRKRSLIWMIISVGIMMFVLAREEELPELSLTATTIGAVSGEEELTLDPRPSSSVSITVGTPAPMNTFTLRYNANGGSGAPSSQSVETTADSVVMTVSSVQPTRHGYHFCGWALTPNGHVAYRSGNEITLTGDVTLYAVWVTPTASPQTGDSSNVALWAAMAGISLAAGAVVLFVLKKRKAE